MAKDHSERRTYRKSPGRQYGYEYDPLRSRSESSQSGKLENSGQSERWSSHGETAHRSGALLAHRPDPRRTRQLLRQNIIASKARAGDIEDEQGELELHNHSVDYDEYEDSYYEPAPRNVELSRSPMAQSRELIPAEDYDDEWDDSLGDIDPDIGYEDPLDVYAEYEAQPARPSAQTPIRARQNVPTRSPSRAVQPAELDEYDEYDEEEERPTLRPRRRKKKVSRRALLVGAGVAAVGATGIAAYELVPKIPGAIGDVGSNLEKQLQDAFNRGVSQGADNVRKEFITALQDLEGFTLEGAYTAARFTRMAYSMFVSPIIQYGSALTGDFLTGMLKALKTARGWLAGVNQDNATLSALQKVLETWVSNNSTKQLDAIVKADLDGAQAYLKALQRKIDEEKAKLNDPKGASATPTAPAANPTPKK